MARIQIGAGEAAKEVNKMEFTKPSKDEICFRIISRQRDRDVLNFLIRHFKEHNSIDIVTLHQNVNAGMTLGYTRDFLYGYTAIGLLRKETIDRKANYMINDNALWFLIRNNIAKEGKNYDFINKKFREDIDG